jgi:hypothetical protein
MSVVPRSLSGMANDTYREVRLAARPRGPLTGAESIEEQLRAAAPDGIG